MPHTERSFRPAGSLRGAPISVLDDVAYLRTVFVNVVFLGSPESGRWVLVDTGLPGFADAIVEAAARRFGEDARPVAIVLTHGHFDHVGTVRALADRWSVDVFAHPLELPYLTGRSKYPPPDPTVGGGAMAALSPTYPRGPIDLGDRVRALPDDGAVPGLPGWRWLATPGHSPGHVSLFRDRDRVLVAGDAVVTTKQESATAVFTQRRELHGPPMYFTPDWESAQRSVDTIAALEPAVLVSGHGQPMQGPALAAGLHTLARDFRTRAMPRHGRYVDRPAVADARGVVSVPPATSSVLPTVLLGVGAAVAVTALTAALLRDDEPDVSA